MSLRVDTMTKPPVPGRTYRVRCVNWQHPETGRLYWIPALGTPHTDKEIGSTAACEHVHYDFRFISVSMLRACFALLDTRSENDFTNETWLGFYAMVRAKQPQVAAPQPPFAFVTKKMRCVRAQPHFGISRSSWGDNDPVYQKLTARVEEICAGRKLDPARPYCPHRGVYLGNQPVDSNGCVICPAHGAMWNMTTGDLVTRYDDCPPKERERIRLSMARLANTPCDGGLMR